MPYDPEKAKALIARIEESRRDFEREIQTRRRLLSTLEPPPPPDPMIEAIDDAWDRLGDLYRQKFAPHFDARIEAMRRKRAEIEGKRAEEAKIERERQERRDQTIREKAARDHRAKYEGRKNG